MSDYRLLTNTLIAVLLFSCLTSFVESLACSSSAAVIIGFILGVSVLGIAIIAYIYSRKFSLGYISTLSKLATFSFFIMLLVTIAVKAVSRYSCGFDTSYIAFVGGAVVLVLAVLIYKK